ncbi:MAG: hypothetical protein H0U00_05760 [Actinobacteria bacterium]|nr:hypothetical protein [Actinomycetota bacterium]
MSFGRRYGMPFGLVPKSRPAATGRGCRAVVAARLLEPGSEWRVLRALQLAYFTTSLLLDDDEQIRDVLLRVDGIDTDAIVDRLDDLEVAAEYARDRAEARTAAGSPADPRARPLLPTVQSASRHPRSSSRVKAGGWSPAAGSRSSPTTFCSRTSTAHSSGGPLRRLRSRFSSSSLTA